MILPDQRFGHWIARHVSERRDGLNVMWWCKCDCGKIQEVRATYLTTGKSTQCQTCAGQIGFAAARARKVELRNYALSLLID